VINGIVSRYNEWAAGRNVAGRAPPIWILAGDFNSTPESAEIRHLKDMNFIDLNPNKGSGTKSKGMPIEAATITLDYIFAGPAYFALDPYIVNQEIQGNPAPLDSFRVSDHLPVLADIPIVINP
jgi:endonuclease/exonuclease/phosphatase family metal-dependent hydrolase